MKYRELGKTGLQVSEIGVGAWQLGGPLLLDGKADGHPELGRDFCINLIRQCGDLGINFVDTAEQYGNGESERRVGVALKGRRGQWIISTKFGNQVGPNGERLRDASPKRAAFPRRFVAPVADGLSRRIRLAHQPETRRGGNGGEIFGGRQTKRPGESGGYFHCKHG